MHKKIETSQHYVKVKELKFLTVPSGTLVCILVLESPVVIKSGEDTMTYEILRLNDLTELRKFEINDGQILLVDFHYTTIHDIQMEIVEYKVTMRHAFVPSQCRTCGGYIAVMRGAHRCVNHFCGAKSTISLKLLYAQLTDKLSVDDLNEFEEYLENFPMYDGDARITNIVDYVKIFKTLGNINIQGRVDLLAKKCFSEKIYNFELLLSEKIQGGYYSRNLSWFWDLLPMARNQQSLLIYLPDLDPRLENFSNILTKLPVDDTTKDDFISNVDLIKALFNELTTVS